jgi:RimJ/RimL family protein N-acetyltransferase
MNAPEKKIVLKNGSDITLRSPLPADAEILLKHLRTVFHESYQNMNHPADYFDHFTVEKEEEILKDFSSSNEKFLISAFDSNQIIGNLGIFGQGGFSKHSARLGMGINKSHHGLGLGKEMLSYALSMARENGFLRIELNVRTFNTAGINLYEKMGFSKIGILRNIAFIDGKFESEWMYEKIL